MELMMLNPHTISLLDFVISISGAIDHIDARIANHHKRVAYIASKIAGELNAPEKLQYDLVIAGLLHDIGVLTVPESNFLKEYDDLSTDNGHCEAGYRLLKKFRHFAGVANIIRHHHEEYRYRSSLAMDRSIPMESMVLYLADRIDVLIDKEQPILEQVDRIVATIARDAGSRFKPEYVDAFLELAWRESFLSVTAAVMR